jgi:hypothetical protein
VSSAIVGSGGTLSNSQCSLNAGSSSVSISGNELRLTLALTFAPGFNGLKIVYMEAINNASVFSGWQGKGTWTIP